MPPVQFLEGSAITVPGKFYQFGFVIVM